MRLLAPIHRFTTDEYYRLADAKALAPGARVELLEGQIVDMLPIGPFHADVGSRLGNIFSNAAKGRWIVRNQYPVRLNDGSEPQPDLALVSPQVSYKQRHPTPEDVFLLVEVADSSVVSDREDKLPAYAKAGISEYWIVNLVERVVEVYRAPHPGGIYESMERRRGEDIIAPAIFPDATITVADLLGG